MPGIPPAPTPDQFEQVVKAINPNARVVSTCRLAGGISSRMDVLEYDSLGTSARKVVTRQYWEFKKPEDDNRLFGESAVLRALGANGVPAPEVVIDLEAASKIFGRSAIVISYLEGTPNLAPDDPSNWAVQLATALARIHSTPVTPQLIIKIESAHTDITKWMTQIEPSDRFKKHPLGIELWNAMRQLWPSVDTSATHLLHGDFWPGNTIWDGETLLAIVDWEGPAVGEPMLDVGYFLTDAVYFGIEIEDTFLEGYEKASGNQIEDLLFWKMAAAARAMPDVGPWAKGYSELGIRTMTADEIRRAHAECVQELLDEFNTNR